jgi:hypothetical protein
MKSFATLLAAVGVGIVVGGVAMREHDSTNAVPVSPILPTPSYQNGFAAGLNLGLAQIRDQ